VSQELVGGIPVDDIRTRLPTSRPRATNTIAWVTGVEWSLADTAPYATRSTAGVGSAQSLTAVAERLRSARAWWS
jgi:hypothetical protein